MTYDCYRPFTLSLLQSFDGFQEVLSHFPHLDLTEMTINSQSFPSQLLQILNMMA